MVVLGVLDAEAAGRGLEARERVLVGAEAGADDGARGGEAQGVPPDGQAVGAGLLARDAGEGEDAGARLRRAGPRRAAGRAAPRPRQRAPTRPRRDSREPLRAQRRRQDEGTRAPRSG